MIGTKFVGHLGNNMLTPTIALVEDARRVECSVPEERSGAPKKELK